MCAVPISSDGLQVGACIVNPENKIVGIGYNGMPNKCSDDKLPWERDAPNRLDTKYPYGKYACMLCHPSTMLQVGMQAAFVQVIMYLVRVMHFRIISLVGFCYPTKPNVHLYMA